MASIRLPQAQLSELPAIRKRNPQTEQILQVLGQNPFAEAINTAVPEIADALQKRAALKKQGQQAAKLGSLLGLESSQTSGLDPSTVLSLGSVLESRKEKERKRSEDSYTPEQLNVISTGSIVDLPKVFPNGVPKQAVDMAGVVANRKALDLDRDENRRLREMQEGVKVGEREKVRYRNYILDMEQRDPVIKEINKQDLNLKGLDSLKKLINEGNTLAFTALGTKLAKGYGDAGALSDRDVVRYIRSGAITQRTGDILMSWIAGVPTQATQAEIGQIVKVLETNYKEKLQPRFDQFIESYSSIEGLTPEAFSNKIKIPYGGGSSKVDANAERKARLLEELKRSRGGR